MDDRILGQQDAHPMKGPHWTNISDADAIPSPFPPLRLLLQPSGLIIHITEPDTIVGRHSEADIRLPLPDISRRHCRFINNQGLWQIVDLNSLNGIFVNEQPVQRAVLHQGDSVRIGGFTFLVDLSGQPMGKALQAQPELAESIFRGRNPRNVPRRQAS